MHFIAKKVRCWLSVTNKIGWGTEMEASKLSRTTMRTGAGLAVIAVLLVATGPIIIANLGTVTLQGAAPVAILVTTFHMLTPAVCIIFSAVLVAASLVMRHAESLRDESLTGH